MTPRPDCIDAPNAFSPRNVMGLYPHGVLVAMILAGAFGIESKSGDGPAIEPAAGADYSMFSLAQSTGNKAGFERVTSAATGVDFKNILAGDAFLTDAVAHNGSGVALGDVDGNGWVDIYFCALQGANRLFLNQGEWRFIEAPQSSAACAEQRSTSAVLADVDGDADLDLLVSGIAAGTRLFVNDGNGSFTEFKESGLSKNASPTSMALADLDADGDLDLYCAHYIDVMHIADPTTHYALARRNGQFVVTHVNGEPATSPRLSNRFVVSPTGQLRELPEADGLYLNEGKGRFRAVQFEPGTFTDANGSPVMPYRDWGLSVMFRDLNGDGFPDIYVCNDNASPDRVWINSGKATFRELNPFKLRHTSRSSMGIDFADINRDGLDDFIVVDMFSADHARRMTQLVKQHSPLETVQQIDGQPRYNRNTLFLGRRDGSFVETALMAGVATTEWSWCPVFLDVDLDGFEDLLVTNGFSFDVMDQDSHDQLRALKLSDYDRKRSRKYHPPLRTENVAFRNKGDGTFEPSGASWGFNQQGVSYGMALGDLDNDGDLDAVINQLNEEALVLRNTTSAPRIKVALEGRSPNTRGIGAKIRLVTGDFIQSQTIINGGRYLSSDEAIRVFPFKGGDTQSSRLEISWPGGQTTMISSVQPNHAYVIRQTNSKAEESQEPEKPVPMFSDASHMLSHKNHNSFGQTRVRDGTLDQLHATGPGASWFDINGDGWEDLWISTELSQHPAVFINKEGTGLEPMFSMPPSRDSLGASIGWNNGQGQSFWLAAASHRASHPRQESAVVVYDVRSSEQPRMLETGPEGIGALCSADIDGDGDLDLFIGGTPALGRYPEPARSQIWINERGSLKYSASWSSAFQEVGIVQGATFFELETDGSPDLALALQWGPVKVFRNGGGGFLDVTQELGLDAAPGWWTGISTGDFDADGRLDLVVGNRGLNTALAIHETNLFGMWFGDQDQNGILETLEAWKRGDRWMPVADRTTLTSLIPDLAKRIPTHLQFGRSSLEDILARHSGEYRQLRASCAESSIFLNRKDGFVRLPLPQEAQWSPIFSVNVADANADGNEDVFLAQNEFPSTTSITRNDDGQGLWLLGRGDGTFTPLNSLVSGVEAFGEQKGACLSDFNHDGRVDLVIAQKEGPTRFYLNQSKQRGYRVTLQGEESNPQAIGSRLRIVYEDGSMGPCRMIQAGSGFGAQDGADQVLGWRSPPEAIRILWQTGEVKTITVKSGGWDQKIRMKPEN